jgi:arylsulfatase A-like enzyme
MNRGTRIRAPDATRLLSFVAGMLGLLVALGLALVGPARAARAQRPSFVVIQTDDETLEQLYAEYTPPGGARIEAMPYTRSLIAARGATFDRYYVSYSLCCPSRVTLLTGRYAHNHNVRGNLPPEGGYPGFARRAAYNHNIAVWLQDAGYRTIHVGKFLNGYGDAPYSNGAEVPPGWSAWHTVLHADTDHYYYGYELNNDGRVEGPYGDSGSWETREYGERDDFGCPDAPLNGKPCYYETDKLTSLATEELQNTPPNRPFYLQLDYTAPHGDFRRPAGPEPAPRYYDTFAGAPLPHNASQGLNEENVRDKPSFVRNAPLLSPEEIHTYRVYYEKALESLRSVDDGVHEIIDALGAAQRLRDTYIIFTSDNGFFYGEHRLAGGKFLAYEPSTHLPFLIRGPGIKPSTRTNQLAANIDIAPTILELAHVKPERSLDGESLFPYAHDPALRKRRPILFESFVQTNDVEENGGGPAAAPARVAAGSAGGGASVNERPRGATASIAAPPKDYKGIILGPYKYIEWPDGEKELYDLSQDPYELSNRVREPNLFPIRNFLRRELARLEDCIGEECRQEAGPFPLRRDQRRGGQPEKHKHH